MRIGTIAQHANIGPHGPASILPNGAIPGRLNNFKFIGWWDFTDNIFSVAPDTNTDSLQLVTDKGPYSANLAADSLSKGPSYNPNTLGQDGHKYAETFSVANNDSMFFTNPININSRRFTAVVICDLNVESLSQDMQFFRINGNFNGQIRFGWERNNELHRLKVARNQTFQNQQIAFGGENDQFIEDVVGGDFQHGFNWFTVVCESDGFISIYSRGIRISLDHVTENGSITDPFPNITLGNQGSISYLFDSRTSDNEPEDSTGNMLDSKIYEVMMFDESLTHQQLYHVDMYVKNKYPSYQFGRVNGF